MYVEHSLQEMFVKSPILKHKLQNYLKPFANNVYPSGLENVLLNIIYLETLPKLQQRLSNVYDWQNRDANEKHRNSNKIDGSKNNAKRCLQTKTPKIQFFIDHHNWKVEWAPGRELRRKSVWNLTWKLRGPPPRLPQTLAQKLPETT